MATLAHLPRMFGDTTPPDAPGAPPSGTYPKTVGGVSQSTVASVGGDGFPTALVWVESA